MKKETGIVQKLQADDSVHPSTTVSTNDSSFFHEITHTTSLWCHFVLPLSIAFHVHHFVLINRSSIAMYARVIKVWVYVLSKIIYDCYFFFQLQTNTNTKKKPKMGTY